MSEQVVSTGVSGVTPDAFVPSLGPDDELLELGAHQVLNDFQVVDRRFFANTFEPAISFNKWKFYPNTACLTKFPKADYVQVLVNRDTKIVALRPCLESARDSLAWCSRGGKRHPRQSTARGFFALVFPLMGWDLNTRYKVLGKLVHANGIYLLAFDLKSADSYPSTAISDSTGAEVKLPAPPSLPDSEPGSFGMKFNEHEQSLQINLFDGFAFFSVKSGDQQPTAVTPELLESDRSGESDAAAEDRSSGEDGVVS